MTAKKTTFRASIENYARTVGNALPGVSQKEIRIGASIDVKVANKVLNDGEDMTGDVEQAAPSKRRGKKGEEELYTEKN